MAEEKKEVTERTEVSEQALARWLRALEVGVDFSPADLAFALSAAFEIFER